jgi:hypothetical protein
MKRFKHLVDLKIGENITSKRRRISRIPCEVEWKKLFLVEKKLRKIFSKKKGELEPFYSPVMMIIIYVDSDIFLERIEKILL